MKKNSCIFHIHVVTCEFGLQYTPGLMVELDLLIIGGYYGEGRRRGLVSHFLLGVAQPSATPGQFVYFLPVYTFVRIDSIGL